MDGLTLAIVLITLWAAVVIFFRYYKIWLPFYLVGAVGSAFAVIFLGRELIPLEPLLEGLVAYETFLVTTFVGIPTQLYQGAPGLLLVLVVSQPVGWTAVQITIECSGLLESAVLIGMLGFYPGFPILAKIRLILVGLVLTHLANLVRLLFIIATLHYLGKDALFMAHTVVGRVVFFVAVVAIYWRVLTVPTIAAVRRKLQSEIAQ